MQIYDELDMAVLASTMVRNALQLRIFELFDWRSQFSSTQHFCSDHTHNSPQKAIAPFLLAPLDGDRQVLKADAMSQHRQSCFKWSDRQGSSIETIISIESTTKGYYGW
jgi:hypothetical protein